MNLIQKQKRFSILLSDLIYDLTQNGYEVTMGECWRSKAAADWNAAHGIGISNSLHTQRLAADLNLFKDGKYLTTKDDYAVAGAIWKSYTDSDFQCCWGGDFESPDSDHFSISHGSIR